MNKVAKKRLILFFLILFVILFSLYFRTFNYDYIWDSKIQISNNIFLNKKISPFKAFEYGYWQSAGFNKGANDYYRPFTIMTLALNKKFFGENPSSFRIVNLIIFYLSLIPLFLFLKEHRKDDFFAEIFVLLFAVYPLHIDNIVWIVGRCDLLMLLWGFLSLLFFEYYIKNNRKRDAVFSILFFISGLFSKEAFVFFLPFFILYNYVRKRKIHFFYLSSIILSTLFFFFVKFKVNGVGGVKFSLFHPFVKNLLLLLGSIGYYFKSMILPLNFIMFVSAESVLKVGYFIWGILFLILFSFLILLSIRSKREFMVPLLFLLVFFPLYLVFVFSNLFPYSLSTRYMIIPFLGILWILILFIFKLRKKTWGWIVLFIVIIFSISVIFNSYFYKSEVLFWGKIVKKQPNVAFVNAEYSRALLLKSNYIEAETYLKRTLKLKMEEFTAVLTGILYANIELKRCNYDKALKWLDSVKKLRVELPSLKDIYTIKFNIAKYRGNFLKAEKIAKKALSIFSEKGYFLNKLYNLYICFDKWKEAETLAKRENINIYNLMLLREKLDAQPEIELIKYYSKCGNYKKAINLIENHKDKEYSISELFSIAEIYFRGEEKEKGESIIKKIYENNRNNYIILKAIGVFYLNKLVQMDKALFYFRKSLKINPHQPFLKRLIKKLNN